MVECPRAQFGIIDRCPTIGEKYPTCPGEICRSYRGAQVGFFFCPPEGYHDESFPSQIQRTPWAGEVPFCRRMAAPSKEERLSFFNRSFSHSLEKGGEAVGKTVKSPGEPSIVEECWFLVGSTLIGQTCHSRNDHRGRAKAPVRPGFANLKPHPF